jgi:dTDP-4-amino-4,6-dideoxygalactose transaminase
VTVASRESTSTPAIAGGKPAKTTPYGKAQRYGEAELQQLREALAEGTLFYAQGRKVFDLEKQFAACCAAKHGVAASSATASIHAALMALGISPGDEVIVSPITDMGSIHPILWQGAVPVFADLDSVTYVMTPQTIAAKVTPATRAIIPVHLAGNACDMRPIMELARRRNVAVIEDCAQAHGTRYQGEVVGTFGDIGCFSFNEWKHISCGDGGVAITNDETLAKKLRLATDKAYDRSPGVAVRDPTFLAANYRMTELQAAVAIAQLAKLDSILARRQSWCGRLLDRLRGLPGLQLPQATSGVEHSWWFFMLRVLPELGASADDFAAALKAEGVPAAAHYIARCIYEYPLFQNHSPFARNSEQHPFTRHDYRAENCWNAKQILDTCVVLAVNEAYTDHDLDETACAFQRVVSWFQSKR